MQTISRVARSASRDETRPVLTGHPDVGLRAASCGWSPPTPTACSVKETALETPLQGALEANVPARALQELARIAQQDTAETLSVSVGQNQVVFELGETWSSPRG